MIKRHKIIDTAYHSLYSKRVPAIKERYNYRKEKYQSLSSWDFRLFNIDSYLKSRDSKLWHKLFFNRLFFWKKPLFRVNKSGYERYRLYIGRFHSHPKDLHSLFYQLREASSSDTLELVICSRGGSIDEGQQFSHLILEKFHDRTVAYLDNYGYSMGAMLFCMVKKRVIYPYSELMFHNYSDTSSGKGGEIRAKVEHTDEQVIKFKRDVIVKQGFLNEEEFQRMLIGQDFWMGSEEICRRGIATHVIVDGKEIEAEEYLKLLD